VSNKRWKANAPALAGAASSSGFALTIVAMPIVVEASKADDVDKFGFIQQKFWTDYMACYILGMDPKLVHIN